MFGRRSAAPVAAVVGSGVVPDALPRLSRGHHRPSSSKACALDAVSFLSGAPACGDQPSSVHGWLYQPVWLVNDRLGDVERQQLWSIVPDLAGTSGAPSDAAFAKSVVAAGYRALVEVGVCTGKASSSLSAEQIGYALSRTTPEMTVKGVAMSLEVQARRALAAGAGVSWLKAVAAVFADAAAGRSTGLAAVELDWTALLAAKPATVAVVRDDELV